MMQNSAMPAAAAAASAGTVVSTSTPTRALPQQKLEYVKMMLRCGLLELRHVDSLELAPANRYAASLSSDAENLLGPVLQRFGAAAAAVERKLEKEDMYLLIWKASQQQDPTAGALTDTAQAYSVPGSYMPALVCPAVCWPASC